MNTTKLRTFASTAVLGLLIAALGCADLSIDNPNAPDRDRALATAGDVESLISGSFHTAYIGFGAGVYSSSTFFLSASSFQHSTMAANAGAVFYSAFPRPPIQNNPANQFYGNFANVYQEAYGALSAARSGLQSINESEEIRSELGAASVERARAFAKFAQGLAHASVALQYDQGFIVDETVDVAGGDLTPVSHDSLMSAAMGYFDEAISLSEGASWSSIPSSWMSRSVDRTTFIQLIHTLKARYMAASARNPQERQNVNWEAVLSELDQGLSSFDITLTASYDTNEWITDVAGYWPFGVWQAMPYFMHGMADQSGTYQDWLAQPLGSRSPEPGGEPFLIHTPDTRFPDGETLSEQFNNPGEYFAVPGDGAPVDGAVQSRDANFSNPGRGLWRHSYYVDVRPDAAFGGTPGYSWAWINEAQTRLLEAEAHLRTGNPGQAAQLINVSRTAHGLNETDASGTNSSCVPRLPNGDCGDLEEMLKWEYRLEGAYHGLNGVPWYYHGRGWGDLYAGTPIHFPLPAQEANVLGIPTYTLGGAGQEGGAPVSTYQFPGES